MTTLNRQRSHLYPVMYDCLLVEFFICLTHLLQFFCHTIVVEQNIRSENPLRHTSELCQNG